MLVRWTLPTQDSPTDETLHAFLDTCTNTFVTLLGNQTWSRRQDFLQDLQHQVCLSDAFKARLRNLWPAEDSPPNPETPA